jgi:hypothetical protein
VGERRDRRAYLVNRREEGDLPGHDERDRERDGLSFDTIVWGVHYAWEVPVGLGGQQ